MGHNKNKYKLFNCNTNFVFYECLGFLYHAQEALKTVLPEIQNHYHATAIIITIFVIVIIGVGVVKSFSQASTFNYH
jgi:hypothetical protein